MHDEELSYVKFTHANSHNGGMFLQSIVMVDRR
jgi:hypothetical protein